MKILKGNYETKNNPEVDAKNDEKVSFESEFKKKAIENIGGSMVFVERKKMVWDGDT